MKMIEWVQAGAQQLVVGSAHLAVKKKTAAPALGAERLMLPEAA